MCLIDPRSHSELQIHLSPIWPQCVEPLNLPVSMLYAHESPENLKVFSMHRTVNLKKKTQIQEQKDIWFPIFWCVCVCPVNRKSSLPEGYILNSNSNSRCVTLMPTVW